jgi:hypothetical protein
LNYFGVYLGYYVVYEGCYGIFEVVLGKNNLKIRFWGPKTRTLVVTDFLVIKGD